MTDGAAAPMAFRRGLAAAPATGRQAPESEMEALFREQLQTEQGQFAKMKYRNKVGLFEGANYHAQGYYRSSADCTMFTRSMTRRAGSMVVSHSCTGSISPKPLITES